MKQIFFIGALLLGVFAKGQEKDIYIAFISDVHFGIKRIHFRNSPDSVSSYEVNRALSDAIKSLGKVNYIIVTGDIANREEGSIQPASVSWKQFLDIYQPLHIPMLLTPGNHDVTNAIGFYKPMNPLKDAGSLMGIYSMIHPGHSLDTAHLTNLPEQFDYSENIGGIHFLFVTLWPDSANRVWMKKDLSKINPKMPVFIFTHDPPEGNPRQFTNPTGNGINPQDRYEDLLSEVYNSQYEREWDDFLKEHQDIKGYFHGHENYQEFYTYKGVDSTLSLPCFRVDSPMKGKLSSKDESLLSFQLIIIHPDRKRVEIKECLWNRGKKIKWGQSKILQL